MQIFFNLLTPVTAELTTSNFIFIVSIIAKADGTTCLCSFCFPVYFVRSSSCTENF